MLEIRSLDKTMKEKKFNSYGCGFKVSNAFYTTSYVGYFFFLLLLVSTLTLVQRRQEKLHSNSLKDAGDNEEVLTTQLYLYFKKNF